MKIKAKQAAFIIPFLLILFIGGTKITGQWKTERSNEPLRISTGENEGEYDPADIRGSYSFQEISDIFDIPLESLLKAAGFESREEGGSIQLKELEETYSSIEEGEVGTDSFRWFTALYKGLPYIPEETTLLPRVAYSILKTEGSVDAETLKQLEDRFIQLENLILSDSQVIHEESSEERLINGTTTFGELLQWNISQEEIENILGIPMGTRSETVRDFCQKNSVSFSNVKSELQLLLDR